MTRLILSYQIVLYLLVALCPLLTPVGRNFEYEYTILVAWLALIFLPLFSILFPKSSLSISPGWPQPLALLRVLLLYTFLLPLLPFFVGSLAFASGWCLCSFPEFGFWYGVNTWPALVLAQALSLGLNALSRGGRRKAWAGLGFFVFHGLALVDLSARLWFFPQKRLTHFVYGFLHGPIYDEWIAVDAGILWLRLAHLALAWAFLAGLCFYPHRRWQTCCLAAALSLSLAGYWLSAPYNSTGLGHKALQKTLTAHRSQPHFVLYYEQPRDHPEVPLPVLSLERQASFHMGELIEKLDLQNPPQVAIYLYSSEDQKKLLFGGGETDVTDVYTPSVHLTATDFPHPTLRHELVHALTSSFAYHGLGFHPNLALTEGIAVALAPEWQALSLHAGAGSLLHDQRVADLELLFSPLFWSLAGPRAYTLAGSLISYLGENYEVSKLKHWLQGASLQTAYGFSQAELLAMWRPYVLSRYREEDSGLVAEALFRSPGLWGERCPHSREILHAASNARPFISWRRPRGWQAERDYWPWLLALEGEQPAARGGYLSWQAASLLSDRSLSWKQKAKRGDALLAELARGLPSEPRVLEDVELLLLQSDLRRLKDRQHSLKILDDLSGFERGKPFGESLSRQLYARLEVERQLGDKDALPWRLYLAGAKTLPSRLRKFGPDPLDEAWILQYLRLRSGYDSDWQKEEVLRQAFRQSLDASQPLAIRLQWYHQLAQEFSGRSLWPLAGQAWQACEGLAPPGKKAKYGELVRMAEYFQRQGKSLP